MGWLQTKPPFSLGGAASPLNQGWRVTRTIEHCGTYATSPIGSGSTCDTAEGRPGGVRDARMSSGGKALEIFRVNRLKQLWWPGNAGDSLRKLASWVGHFLRDAWAVGKNEVSTSLLEIAMGAVKFLGPGMVPNHHGRFPTSSFLAALQNSSVNHCSIPERLTCSVSRSACPNKDSM